MASAVLNHNKSVLADLEPGDLIEFKRGIYSHWAVYKGEGHVIHLAGDENDGLNAAVNSGSVFTICGQRFGKAFVRKDDFWKVAAGCKAIKNNEKDKKQSPRSAAEIVETALSMIGEIGYNILWGNCEHFAKFCRYGEPSSDQVEGFFTGAAMAAGVALLAVGANYLFRGSKKEDKEEVES